MPGIRPDAFTVISVDHKLWSIIYCEHLVASVYWRKLLEIKLPDTLHTAGSAEERGMGIQKMRDHANDAYSIEFMVKLRRRFPWLAKSPLTGVDILTKYY